MPPKNWSKPNGSIPAPISLPATPFTTTEEAYLTLRDANLKLMSEKLSLESQLQTMSVRLQQANFIIQNRKDVREVKFRASPTLIKSLNQE